MKLIILPQNEKNKKVSISKLNFSSFNVYKNKTITIVSIYLLNAKHVAHDSRNNNKYFRGASIKQ